MPTAPGAPPLQPYDPEMFVDRDEEIEAVLTKARQLSEGTAVRVRTIVFWGHRGVGKTWLLRELHDNRLKKLPGVRPVYVDLALVGKEDPIARLTREIDDGKSENDVLVILLDYVYETDKDVLEKIEGQSLVGLVSNPKVLILIAGRGEAHVWKTPQMRLYTEEIHLEPFNDLDFTQMQIQRQQPGAESRARNIHELSGGYPLGSYLLAATTDEGEALEQAASALLDGVSDDVRGWAEALCVLNGFDEDRMPALLAIYHDDPTWRDKPFKEMRAVRDGLLHARLANWDENLGGWVIDAAVRKIVEEYLKLAQPVKWQALHRAACCLFAGWQRQYPSERERWHAQADYHCACLTDAGYERPDCPDGKTES